LEHVAFHRGERVSVRLSAAEMAHLERVMKKTGLTNISETVRFLINMSKLQTEGSTTVYPNPEALINWLEDQGLIVRVNNRRGEA